MGLYAGLNIEAYDRKYNDKELVQRMLRYFRPQSRRIIIIAVLVLLTSITGAITPIVIGRGVDIIRQKASSNVTLLLFSVIFILGFFGWVANWLRRRLTVRTVSDVELALRTEVFKAAAGHDLPQHR